MVRVKVPSSRQSAIVRRCTQGCLTGGRLARELVGRRDGGGGGVGGHKSIAALDERSGGSSAAAVVSGGGVGLEEGRCRCNCETCSEWEHRGRRGDWLPPETLAFVSARFPTRRSIPPWQSGRREEGVGSVPGFG